MKFARLALAAVTLLAATPHAALAQSVTEAVEEETEQEAVPQQRRRTPRTTLQAGTGFSYSDGDYGQSMHTQVVAVPLRLRVRRGPWFGRVSISYVTIDGPAAIIDTDLDGEAEAEGEAADMVIARQSRSGLGDLSLLAGRHFDLFDSLRLTTDARIKFPTASEAKRLTTGTTDVTLRAHARQKIGALSLTAGARRRFAGGGGRATLRDTWGLYGGASLDLGGGIVTGVDYSWLQSSYAGSSANSRVIGHLSVPLSRRLRLTGYGGPGLSRNSADVTVGTSISLRLD